MKLSEILGKELYGAHGICGYVRGVYALDGKIEYLACADIDENEFDADMRDIAVKSKSLYFNGKRAVKGRCVCLRAGMPAYTADGRFLGVVKDIAVEKNTIKNCLIGGKKYPATALCFGDVVILREGRILKEDVIKDGKAIIKKGTPLDGDALATAESAGEYIQAQLKSI